MNVQVVSDAGACRRAEIHAHIKARGRIDLTQGRLRPLGHVHQLIRNLFCRRIKLTRVQVRNDHEMPGDVGIKIEDHKTVLGPLQNKIRFILVGITRDQTEHATIALRINA